ncbi:pyridoxal phosphate-dependent aminotransferase [Zooshikella marina]|uniref:pyridoxal phosphate-dependent aminotransferase n=1 Tax=Zooshikella ganghwensis TaxID=202772 RepID=UPI001BB00FF0|nr:pyridoxal phosphate-dependent aminotransferase [Zooshikella ganghwensis]MBU2707939.1 pyridoxal phosphate-dependent aminotransferase [Zooshikella ganghwensis]
MPTKKTVADPSDKIYESFSLFIEAARSVKTVHMSAGVNWQDASPAIISLLQKELETGLTYKNYGRSAGGKIITDILSYVERDIVSAKNKIDSVIVNGASDGAHVLCSYLLESGIINKTQTGIMIGYAFPIYSSLMEKLGIDYTEVMNTSTILPSIEQVESSIHTIHPSLIILPLPHNPSGIIRELAYYRRIFTAARKVNAIVIVDRVCLMPWDTHIELNELIYHEIALGSTFVIDSMSKSNSLAGIRIGYILTNHEHLSPLEKEIRYRNLNPTVFGTPTMALCRVGDLALLKGIAFTQKYIRLLTRYSKHFWLEYPSDFTPPNLGAIAQQFLASYIRDQQQLKQRIDINFNNINKLFSTRVTQPIILDGGFNVLLQLPEMITENENNDQLVLAKKYGICILTKNCFHSGHNTNNNYFVRLSLTIPEHDFLRGLTTLYDYYKCTKHVTVDQQLKFG